MPPLHTYAPSGVAGGLSRWLDGHCRQRVSGHGVFLGGDDAVHQDQNVVVHGRFLQIRVGHSKDRRDLVPQRR
jgi:hypothetical protein